jgi:predicted GH43/DUF377 family glycosyl hydrolase
MPIAVTRTHQRLAADPRRVLAKPFMLGEELLTPGPSRAGLLLDRILAIPEAEVEALVEDVVARYAGRHRDFEQLIARHCEAAVGGDRTLSPARRRLIGAYFTHEYSIEAAALFNPSIVFAPDDGGEKATERRFVMSLRAVGEGHISSIELRAGAIDARGQLTFDTVTTLIGSGRRTPPRQYEKRLFAAKLVELSAWNAIASAVLGRLPERFSPEELEASLGALDHGQIAHAIWFETAKMIRVLAASNYVVTFPPDRPVCERVLFPAGPNETHGMEDARFVRFVEGAAVTYFATYTAYDGYQIVPQLIETGDFVTFSIRTLNGEAAQNKGMALFPRKVGGHYMMLSRKDRENLHLSSSDNIHFWNDVEELYRPTRPWELLQMGNCGSPLETEAGWLVLTHGVGAMREYAIGALLLDLEDPLRVLGCLPRPLIAPNEDEREGYVPNVLYSCGSLIVGDKLVLPYGFSDAGVGVATVSLSDLLTELTGPDARMQA